MLIGARIRNEGRFSYLHKDTIPELTGSLLQAKL
jgi:hypothetical protein